jgi:hypothetical protein
MDTNTKRAALFLLLTPGPLAEVVSQNVQLLTFLQPVPFLLVTLTYGVPVLLIRELAVAHDVDEVGLVLLGLAYGVLNEGVLAKTLTLPAGPPLHDLAGYGQIGPIQGGWSMFIIVWHAFHSVFCPIILTQWMFPATANRRWFAARGARLPLYLLVILVAALYSLYFLNPVRRDAAVFAVYAVVTACLVAAALKLCKRRERQPTDHHQRPFIPALLGGCMIIVYLFQFWAPRHVPFALYLVVSSGVFGIVTVALHRGRWRPLPDWLLFSIGDNVTFCIFSALVCVMTDRNPAQAVVAMTIFLVAFAYLIRSVMLRPDGRAIRGAPAHGFP